MKHAGTLKLEIVCPDGRPWSEVKPRMFALRKTASQALTVTMQDLHAGAIAEIRSLWEGDSKEARASAKAWRKRAEKTLRENWNATLERESRYRGDTEQSRHTCSKVTEALTAETIDNILARFSGQHMKDLIAGRSGFPQFVNGTSFYARSRTCRISGPPDAARLTFPLWGTGKAATSLIVAVKGGSARAQWRKLVDDFSKREQVVSLETDMKDPARKKFALRKLEKMQITKMGRIGLTYDERRRKWFATVSFVQYLPDATAKGQRAACNFGVNVFIQAVAEDGTSFTERGDQILAKRLEGSEIRRRIQGSLRTMGSGSKNRGAKRRMLPITKRRGDESRFVETYNRQLAARIIEWCRRHGISDLYLEDLGGIRDAFERATEGQAHEEVKRRIHHWPYYQTQQALARQGAEKGVRVYLKSARYVSQRCPSCGHTEPENVQEIQVPSIPLLLTQVGPNKWVSGRADGALYRQIVKTSRFECRSCGKRGASDFIACVNHLLDAGATFEGKSSPFDKAQEKARKRVSGSKAKKVRRKN